jgi:hypothetical protein
VHRRFGRRPETQLSTEQNSVARTSPGSVPDNTKMTAKYSTLQLLWIQVCNAATGT